MTDPAKKPAAGNKVRVDSKHLTALFEHATEGIILTGTDGKILMANPAALRMFGYEEGELDGKQVEVLIPERYSHSHVGQRKEFYEDPQNRVMGHGRELFGKKKNNEDLPIEVSLSFYRQESELFVIAFIVDITYRKQIEANIIRQQKELEKVTLELKKLNSQLEAKVEQRTTILKEALAKLEQSQNELSEALDKERELNEIKSRFVSMASHEFRTPLSTVLSSATLLGKYVKTEEQDRRDKHINRIKDAVKHLNELLEDFLSLGRLDEGKVFAKYSQFDLEEVIHETTEGIRGLLKKDQDFVCEYEGEKEVTTDKNLMKNIMINLLTNAIKFSDEGKVIRVLARVRKGSATVSVIDSGIGISAEDQEHLFSSFFRAKNAVNIQGTGMGLHIVKRYVDLLGGQVKVISELNKGTEVQFTIPVIRE